MKTRKIEKPCYENAIDEQFKSTFVITLKKNQTVKLALDCKKIIHKIKYQTLKVFLT